MLLLLFLPIFPIMFRISFSYSIFFELFCSVMDVTFLSCFLMIFVAERNMLEVSVLLWDL